MKPQIRVGEPFVKNTKQGPGSILEVRDHKNVLELKAAEFCIISFTKIFLLPFFPVARVLFWQ